MMEYILIGWYELTGEMYSRYINLLYFCNFINVFWGVAYDVKSIALIEFDVGYCYVLFEGYLFL